MSERRYDDYELTITVRVPRRMVDRARRREPSEIGELLLTSLVQHGYTMAGDARISVRPLP